MRCRPSARTSTLPSILGRIIHRAVALVDASYGALGVLDETGTHRGQAIDRIAEAVDDLDLTIKQIRMAIFDLERTRDASEGCAAGSSVSSTSRSEGSVSSRGSCSMAGSTTQTANRWRRSWCPACVARHARRWATGSPIWLPERASSGAFSSCYRVSRAAPSWSGGCPRCDVAGWLAPRRCRARSCQLHPAGSQQRLVTLR